MFRIPGCAAIFRGNLNYPDGCSKGPPTLERIVPIRRLIDGALATGRIVPVIVINRRLNHFRAAMSFVAWRESGTTIAIRQIK